MLTMALALLLSSQPLGPSPRLPWITSMDYPSSLMGTRPSGVTQVELGFNQAGRLSSCRVLKSSGTPLLDAMTCRLSVRRGRAKNGEPRVQVHQHNWVAPARH
jgi:outer membrane biosynthesis protein TonB